MSQSFQGRRPPFLVYVITPVLNEEANLPLYAEALRTTLFSHPDYDFRVVFVEDGSVDRSWEIIADICQRDPHFEALRLSRNFGSHMALSAGMDAVPGADCVCTLACDLQDPPDTILAFLEAWRKGADIVWGKRRTRQDDRWRAVTSDLFFRSIRRFGMPRGSSFTTGSFFLVGWRVVECMRRFPEQNRVMFALVAWTGFSQATVEYDRKQRNHGRSSWTLAKMVIAAFDIFLGYSRLPARVSLLLGGATMGLSVLFLAVLSVLRLLGGDVPGQAWLGGAMGGFFGLQFLLMGVMGEYLYRIYIEVLNRPLYFVSERTGKCGAGCAPCLEANGTPPRPGASDA